jgi:hypothetical protein
LAKEGGTVEYVNRQGDRYFVLQGKTKTGKPKFYCARKPSGVPVERLPAGYELHEHPASAVVTVRKVRRSRILPPERELVEKLAGELTEAATIIEVEGDSLVVYAADIGPRSSDRLVELLSPGLVRRTDMLEKLARFATYSPMLRLTLLDEDRRTFSVERWCYLGRVDDWIPLTTRGRSLADAARQYLPHLGQESFFELM